MHHRAILMRVGRRGRCRCSDLATKVNFYGFQTAYLYSTLGRWAAVEGGCSFLMGRPRNRIKGGSHSGPYRLSQARPPEGVGPCVEPGLIKEDGAFTSWASELFLPHTALEQELRARCDLLVRGQPINEEMLWTAARLRKLDANDYLVTDLPDCPDSGVQLKDRTAQYFAWLASTVMATSQSPIPRCSTCRGIMAEMMQKGPSHRSACAHILQCLLSKLQTPAAQSPSSTGT
ncbi:hypothetical protein BDZ88DRAFT_294232 [Geranomyces variabilis]|nr:hypothetical protein BDZ88DRAFT_294232 [Geranomyces variabilis]